MTMLFLLAVHFACACACSGVVRMGHCFRLSCSPPLRAASHQACETTVNRQGPDVGERGSVGLTVE
jgi:hypothetical protein